MPNNAQAYIALNKGLMKQYPQADPATKDPSRIWFGNSRAIINIFGKKLTKDATEKIIKDGLAEHEKEKVTQKASQLGLDAEETRKALSVIPADCSYQWWRNIVWALTNAFGPELAEALVSAWSPDDKNNGKHLTQLMKRSNGRIKLGTLIYYAKQHGYVPPEGYYNNDRTPEIVAFEDVFDNGVNHITIGEKLHRYNGKYYAEVPSGEIKRKIAEYFANYPQKRFQTNTATDNATKYVISRCYVPSENINPPGINLNNGFLQPRYTSNGCVDFKLLSHSSERLCTYCAEFDYNPDADDTEFQKIMDTMLPSASQEILFRILGASLDLNEVRKRKGRAARLLLLYGVGSNGKDTIKEWASMLYGGLGVTAVPLQAFRNADKDRVFGLFPLIYSRLNWSSENAAISIDHCQNLKNFVTGDEMCVEEKQKQGFTIKPTAVGIFNVNELPHITSREEAIASRYAIIEFPYRFKAKPNPKVEAEKQADPRIKGDPLFIASVILPSFLNRVLKGFNDILAHGVDYSSVDHLLDEARRSNSHLLEFIEDVGLVEDNKGTGIAPSGVFNKYMEWCEKNHLMVINDDNKIMRFNDPHQYDKLVRTPSQMTKRLKQYVPNLVTRSHGVRGRLLNLDYKKSAIKKETKQ